MTEMRSAVEWSNTPTNRALEQFVSALAHADAKRLAGLVRGDIRWRPAGGRSIAGVKAFCATMVRHGPAHTLTIEHLLSQGNAGAVAGVVEFGLRRRGFCFIVEFTDAKGSAIAEVVSYAVTVR